MFVAAVWMFFDSDPCRSSRYHRIKAAKALGVAYDGALQFLQREAAAPARGRAGADRALGGLNASTMRGESLRPCEHSSWRGVRRRRIEAKAPVVTFILA